MSSEPIQSGPVSKSMLGNEAEGERAGNVGDRGLITPVDKLSAEDVARQKVVALPKKPKTKAPAKVAPPEPVAKRESQNDIIESLLAPEFRKEASSNKRELKKRKGGGGGGRRFGFIATFFLIVLLPVCGAAAYMAFVAVDQYHSTSSFSVRSIESAAGSDILGMFTQASSGTTSADSYVLLDYIRSERIVQEAEKALPLQQIFAVRNNDYYFGLRPGLPIEDKLEYWRSMVKINYDQTSGIINLEVKAFTPQDAQALANFIVKSCDELINGLSDTARKEVLTVAESEVSLSETRLKTAREAVRTLRDASQEVDPVEGAKIAGQLLGTLEQQRVELEAEISTALTQLSADTPRVRVLRSRLGSIQQQIAAARQRLGSGRSEGEGAASGQASSDVAGRILSYETLETEREFAEKAYVSALASLEKARIEANGKQRYLATFIFPTLSEFAQYPARVWDVVLVFLFSLFAWGVGLMSFYNIRDRV